MLPQSGCARGGAGRCFATEGSAAVGGGAAVGGRDDVSPAFEGAGGGAGDGAPVSAGAVCDGGGGGAEGGGTALAGVEVPAGDVCACTVVATRSATIAGRVVPNVRMNGRFGYFGVGVNT